MPAELKQSDIENKVDPSVARQLDNDVPLEKKLEDFYGICDGLKICMLGTARPNIGVRVSQSTNSPPILYHGSVHLFHLASTPDHEQID